MIKTICLTVCLPYQLGIFRNFSHSKACQFFAQRQKINLSPPGVSWPGWKDEFVLKWHDPMRSMPSSHPGIFTDLVERHIGPMDRHQCLIQMTMKLVKTWTAGPWVWLVLKHHQGDPYKQQIFLHNGDTKHSLAWSIYIISFSLRNSIGGETPPLHHRLNQQEATFTTESPCRPGGSIHVARVKSLQVHTMISTCVDVDTRWKGPKNTLRGWGLFVLVFPAEIQKKHVDTVDTESKKDKPKIVLKKASENHVPCPSSCPRRDRLKYTNDVLQNLLPSFVPLHWPGWSHGSHGFRTGCSCTCTVLATCCLKDKTAITPPNPPKQHVSTVCHCNIDTPWTFPRLPNFYKKVISTPFAPTNQVTKTKISR